MNTQDRSGAQAHTRYFVRCLAGGCVIGSRDENDFGAPLTKREANAIADFENKRSARRREQKLGGNFDFYVDEVKPKTPTQENPTNQPTGHTKPMTKTTTTETTREAGRRTCKCSGNSSLHSSIGCFRCGCGGQIELNQVLQRVIARLDELDEQNSNLIQGLVAADMGECGICGDWFKEKELLRAGDRATCDRCWNLEYFVREEDDDETVDQIVKGLMHEILGGRTNSYRGKTFLSMLPHDRNGVLEEPFLTEYRKHQI